MSEETVYLYRCDAVFYDGGSVEIHLQSFRVIKPTKCGYWISLGCSYQKWVSATGRKRYAHPTKAEAIQSFRARKLRQINILSAQLFNARRALDVPEVQYRDYATPEAMAEYGGPSKW